MPSWEYEDGRYYWAPPDEPFYNEVEIPHAPVSFPEEGCNCACCVHERGGKRVPTPEEKLAEENDDLRSRLAKAEEELELACDAYTTVFEENDELRAEGDALKKRLKRYEPPPKCSGCGHDLGVMWVCEGFEAPECPGHDE